MVAPGPVSWRDGVHITGTPIWCDARRARDVCFVSHGGAVMTARHGQLIATAETLALLARADHRRQAETVLPVPYDRPFTLGTRRLELFPSGHAVGAASLAVDLGGDRVVYTGPVNPRGGGLGGAAALRACSTLVVHAGYAAPEVAFPPVDDAVAAVIADCREIARNGGATVLLVSSPCKGLDVAARLAVAEDLAVVAHRAIQHAARKLGPAVPAVRRMTGRLRPGDVVLWLATARAALDRVALPAGSRIALVSGAAADPEAVAAARADLGRVWSNAADHRALIEYIAATGASAVYCTGRAAEALARSIDSRRRPARALGPPVQMSLFA
jgi:putative mRNA 3-end processing factor